MDIIMCHPLGNIAIIMPSSELTSGPPLSPKNIYKIS